MRIADVRAYPMSHKLAPEDIVDLGLGRTVKRDTVIVKVTTDDGIVGYGESHHGRSPGAVAHLANTTLRQLVLGMDAFDVVGVWTRIYKKQLGSHGMGAAASIAMSGIDMALWDIRGKAGRLARPTSSLAVPPGRFRPTPAALRSASRNQAALVDENPAAGRVRLQGGQAPAWATIPGPRSRARCRGAQSVWR